MLMAKINVRFDTGMVIQPFCKTVKVVIEVCLDPFRIEKNFSLGNQNNANLAVFRTIIQEMSCLVDGTNKSEICLFKSTFIMVYLFLQIFLRGEEKLFG